MKIVDQLYFYLMHRDDPICAVTIDPVTGTMVKVGKPESPELLPPGGCTDAAALRKWWQRRAVPKNQGNIQYLLSQLNLSTPQEYLVKNLGLSLTDHYWIKPLDMELNWENVNFFTNDFRDPIADMQFSSSSGSLDLPEGAYSPSSSTQGELQKKWVIIDGKRCLIKGNHGSHSQESLNEVVASMIHKKQNRMPYVNYKPLKQAEGCQISCICESFTSDSVEFIPAIDVVDYCKKDNAVSLYEHFIAICTQHGMSEESTRAFLEYQILTDFVITNVDRHLNNFGILRDTNTLQWISMAPIFDSGNSMFWKNPKLPEYDDLQNIEVNSFRKKEPQLLSYIQDPTVLNPELLPAAEEIQSVYEKDDMIPCVDSILLGYQKKISLLDGVTSSK